VFWDGLVSGPNPTGKPQLNLLSSPRFGKNREMEAQMSERRKHAWTGQSIAGKYVLGKYLGGTDHGSVFSTEIVHARTVQVAIKLVPAVKVDANKQLARWKELIGISHANLLKVLDCGKCAMEGAAYLYVVQEYADEDLGDILLQRALNTEETRGMIEPVIETLAFLHGQNLVHARIHPGNILATRGQIKLASDSITPKGEEASLASPVEGFSPPEWGTGGADLSADIWSLGATVVAALTQKPPAFGENGGFILPEQVKEPFVRIARESLKKETAQRPHVFKVRSMLNAPIAPVEKQPPKQTVKEPEKVAAKVVAIPVANRAPASVSKRRSPVSPARQAQARTDKKKSYALPVAVVAIAAVLLFAVPKMFRQNSRAATSVVATNPASNKPASSLKPPATSGTVKKTEQNSAPVGPSLREASQPVTPTPAPVAKPATKSYEDAAAKGEVLEQVLPDVSGKAQATIQGTVRLSLRLRVNAAGTVDSAELDTPASSKYFSDQAIKAAKRWQFSAPEVNGRSVESQWLLHFEFTPSATSVRPAQVSP
jgi:TonB family protein